MKVELGAGGTDWYAHIYTIRRCSRSPCLRMHCTSLRGPDTRRREHSKDVHPCSGAVFHIRVYQSISVSGCLSPAELIWWTTAHYQSLGTLSLNLLRLISIIYYCSFWAASSVISCGSASGRIECKDIASTEDRAAEWYLCVEECKSGGQFGFAHTDRRRRSDCEG